MVTCGVVSKTLNTKVEITVDTLRPLTVNWLLEELVYLLFDKINRNLARR